MHLYLLKLYKCCVPLDVGKVCEDKAWEAHSQWMWYWWGAFPTQWTSNFFFASRTVQACWSLSYMITEFFSILSWVLGSSCTFSYIWIQMPNLSCKFLIAVTAELCKSFVPVICICCCLLTCLYFAFYKKENKLYIYAFPATRSWMYCWSPFPRTGQLIFLF